MNDEKENEEKQVMVILQHANNFSPNLFFYFMYTLYESNNLTDKFSELLMRYFNEFWILEIRITR